VETLVENLSNCWNSLKLGSYSAAEDGERESLKISEIGKSAAKPSKSTENHETAD